MSDETSALVADWQNYPIQGYARVARESGTDGHFACPLISHIEDGLWVGGCIDGVTLDADFQTVVSLFTHERYFLGPHTTRHEFFMGDSLYVPPAQQLHHIADIVVSALDRGDKVLVHCQAGLNRSNLIAALALIKRGRTPADAITLLRDRRSPAVLCNGAFESWLLTLEATDTDPANPKDS
jgi:hypothetical protein